VDVLHNSGGFVNFYAIDILARRNHFTIGRGGPPTWWRPPGCALSKRAILAPTVLVTSGHTHLRWGGFHRGASRPGAGIRDGGPPRGGSSSPAAVRWWMGPRFVCPGPGSGTWRVGRWSWLPAPWTRRWSVRPEESIKDGTANWTGRWKRCWSSWFGGGSRSPEPMRRPLAGGIARAGSACLPAQVRIVSVVGSNSRANSIPAGYRGRGEPVRFSPEEEEGPPPDPYPPSLQRNPSREIRNAALSGSCRMM